MDDNQLIRAQLATLKKRVIKESSNKVTATTTTATSNVTTYSTTSSIGGFSSVGSCYNASSDTTISDINHHRLRSTSIDKNSKINNNLDLHEISSNVSRNLNSNDLSNTSIATATNNDNDDYGVQHQPSINTRVDTNISNQNKNNRMIVLKTNGFGSDKMKMNQVTRANKDMIVSSSSPTTTKYMNMKEAINRTSSINTYRRDGSSFTSSSIYQHMKPLIDTATGSISNDKIDNEELHTPPGLLSMNGTADATITPIIAPVIDNKSSSSSSSKYISTHAMDIESTKQVHTTTSSSSSTTTTSTTSQQPLQQLSRPAIQKPQKSLTILKWICSTCQNECIPIIRESRCLCGHRLKEHGVDEKKNDNLRFPCHVKNCRCKHFFYIVAEGSWILRCRCKHKHIDHDCSPGNHACTKCSNKNSKSSNSNDSCNGFDSPWVCNCGHTWSTHIQQSIIVTDQYIDEDIAEAKRAVNKKKQFFYRQDGLGEEEVDGDDDKMLYDR